MKNCKINVKGSDKAILKYHANDSISFTDIAGHKESDDTDTINWNCMRKRESD
jgi:hypothetical protein